MHADEKEDQSFIATTESDASTGDDEEKAFYSNKVKPHTMREVYGFVMYLSSIIIGAFWILWIFVPDQYLERLGMTYRPQKIWTIVLPGFLLASFYFYITTKIYMDLLAISDDNSWMIFVDVKSNIAECPACLKLCTCDLQNRKSYRHSSEEIPIHLVNKFLYDDAYTELS